MVLPGIGLVPDPVLHELEQIASGKLQPRRIEKGSGAVPAALPDLRIRIYPLDGIFPYGMLPAQSHVMTHDEINREYSAAFEFRIVATGTGQVQKCSRFLPCLDLPQRSRLEKIVVAHGLCIIGIFKRILIGSRQKNKFVEIN